jgi:hypothetical protein
LVLVPPWHCDLREGIIFYRPDVGIGHSGSSSNEKERFMLYAILCYNPEDVVSSWTKEEDDAVMARLAVVQEELTRQGRLGPVARLLPTTAATTLRKGREDPIVIDGPFAETKEQLLGFYIVDCKSLDEALETARDLARANPGTGSYEIRPVGIFRPGSSFP